MNIYETAIEKIKKGAKFKVNLENKCLIINGKIFIENGKYDGELGIEKVSLEQSLAQIESLYKQYQHSVPSERSERKRTKYFQALSEKDLSDDDMRYGAYRDEAQFRLEYHVLAFVLNGSLVWDETIMGKWFWQSPNCKNLVILKQWVESVTNIINNNK